MAQQELQETWDLDTNQMFFMLQHHNCIYFGTTEQIREAVNTPEYQELFGDMSIDEAIDRYECILHDSEQCEIDKDECCLCNE